MEKAKELLLPVPWGHIAAKAWGNQTNFPVLCVHGMQDNAAAFDRLIVQLPKNFYYVSIDLPGHGLSSYFPSGLPLHFFNYVLSIRYVVEGLKWKNFDFIGHSLGCQLGTFYSIIYPKQIQKLVLIDGLIPRTYSNRQIIPQLKKAFDSTVDAYHHTEHKLYTYDEIMYSLKYRRQNCLNTEAAEALFNRSVSQVGELFKFNRDVRLKGYSAPLFNSDQMMGILNNLNVDILLFITSGTYDLITQYQDRYKLKAMTNIVGSLSNIKLINVIGNHDVHNNNPERLSYDISKFLDQKNINSKL